MFDGFGELPDILLRLVVAAALGGVLGIEREFHGQWAGMRTHMTVGLGSAIFVLLGLAVVPESDTAQATRVIQGIAAGIGFLGAGTILKLSDQLEVKGLTTAGSIWLTAALGTAAGLAKFQIAITAGLIAVIILAVLRPFEKRLEGDRKDDKLPRA